MRRKRQARTLRVVRKVHRQTGILLFLLFIIMAFSGILLGWKKNSRGYLLPKTISTQHTDPAKWMSMSALIDQAERIAQANNLDPVVDRIDARPKKGVVKFTFKNHYWGLQLDPQTAELLQLSKRRSDWIENLHDGSLVEEWLPFQFPFKLIYTSIMGVALLLFSFTGFWLWYGPKRMRKSQAS